MVTVRYEEIQEDSAEQRTVVGDDQVAQFLIPQANLAQSFYEVTRDDSEFTGEDLPSII